MGAYLCEACDKMFCSHEVNYYHCEKCKTDFCEDCWMERLDENQDEFTEICGNCYIALREKARELTEIDYDDKRNT